MTTLSWLNGAAASSIPLDDRGFLYGDGVFRTLRRVAGEVPLWGAHLDKLHRDAEVLGIGMPEADVWQADLQAALAVWGEADAVIKLTLTRGCGPRGYRPPDGIQPNRLLQLSPLPHYPESHYQQGVDVQLSALRLGHQPQLAGIKHLNRLDNVLARQALPTERFFEGILLDQEGWVVEGIQSNLIVRLDGELLTPALRRCGVAGLTRDRWIEVSRNSRQPLKCADLTLEMVLAADRMWLCNSLIGVMPVRELHLTQQVKQFAVEALNCP